MHDDRRRRDERDAEARIAKRIEFEQGGPGEYQLLLEGAQVGKATYAGNGTWTAHLLVDGAFEELPERALLGGDDEDSVRRYAVGAVAHELARRRMR